MTTSRCTYSGAMFNILDPKVEDVRFIDIAHHLSQIPRFTGGTYKRISVARHSMNVSKIILDWDCGPKIALYGLLHDAHEYISSDIPTPFKKALQHVSGMEDIITKITNKIDEVVFQAAGLPSMTKHISGIIKEADEQALLFEVQNFVTPNYHNWGIEKVYHGHLEGTLSPEIDEAEFLSTLSFLQREMRAEYGDSIR